MVEGSLPRWRTRAAKSEGLVRPKMLLDRRPRRVTIVLELAGGLRLSLLIDSVACDFATV